MTGRDRSKPLLELREVSCHFSKRGTTVRAVDGVSLVIFGGETVGLVGESGSGKSTLGRASLALQAVTAGQVLLEGVDLAELTQHELRMMRRRMQIVFQDPHSSLNPRMQVHEAIAEPLSELGIGDRSHRASRVIEMMEVVGLSQTLARRYPTELSGGQAQRVAIARALAVGPSLLVADEAVSALDVSVGAQVLNLLGDLRAQLGLSYLFISHDLGVVEHISDRVAVMYMGRIIEEGRAGQVFREPQHPYTVALLSATPRFEAAGARRRERIILRGEPPSPAALPSGCRFRTRCPIGPLHNSERTVCVDHDPPVVQSRPGHWTACHFAGELENVG